MLVTNILEVHKMCMKVIPMSDYSDYKDAINQTKNPWMSKCMSELYDSLNMDYLEYPQGKDVNIKKQSDKDITK